MITMSGLYIHNVLASNAALAPSSRFVRTQSHGLYWTGSTVTVDNPTAVGTSFGTNRALFTGNTTSFFLTFNSGHVAPAGNSLQYFNYYMYHYFSY